MNDLVGAIIDLQNVISLFADEPADFHALGILLLQSGATVESIEAFGNAIRLSEEHCSSYYINSSLLFRAEACLKRGDYACALENALRLPSGYGTYISGSGMRSKEIITAEATKALDVRRKNEFRFNR